MEVKIINQSPHPLPAYATEGSSGMDLRAFLTMPLTIQPLERRLVPTGLFLEIPAGFEAQVRPRSGLAVNYGVTVLNTPGTIDSDYRGEVKVILVNLSAQPVTIHDGDRIAQIVFQRVEHALLVQSEFLANTERGVGGFGHTGKQ
jgi:dUTP pyrophosphatase